MSTIFNLKLNEGVFKEVLANVSVTEGLVKGSGKPYLTLSISDNKDSIKVNIWDNNPKFNDYLKIPTNSFVKLNIAFMGKKNGYETYEIKDLSILKRPSLVDCVDIPKLQKELKSILNQISDKDLSKLLYTIFKDKELINKIFNAPLTEKTAYSFRGGVLANMVRTAHMAISICDVLTKWDYNKGGFVTVLNKDLMITGAILSKIGSIETLEIVDDVVRKTFKGELNESSYYTAKILLKYLDGINLDEHKKELLEHVITSSNGRLQYGAINTPRSKEAVALAEISRLDILFGSFEYLDRISFGGEFAKLNEKLYCLADYN